VKALSAADGELEAIRQELLTLVHQKIERLKRRAARLLLEGDHLEPERRKMDVVDPFPISSKKAA
jgi:DNA-binding LacI/PurR family transcriptional regulator